MPNQAKGEVKVDWDKPRVLVFSFETMVAIEEMTGLDLLIKDGAQGVVVYNALRRPNLTMLRAMIFGLLNPTDPSVTKARAGEILLEVGPLKVFPKVIEAVSIGMDLFLGGNAERAATPGPQSAPPGSGSGPSELSDSAAQAQNSGG